MDILDVCFPLYVFVVIERRSRRLIHCNITAHPSATWTLQQLRETIGFQDRYEYLLHDRDSIFAKHLDESIAHIVSMSRILFALVVVLSFVPTLRAQDALAGKISCHRAGTEDAQNRSYASKLWDGYEISLGPARNGTLDGNGCTAAVYNSAGHVVFRTTGFSVIFDEKHSGQDFDGDGKPEVVFLTDTGGGMHCCWSYNVVSLSPKPHLLFDLPFGTRFEVDRSGGMLIWEKTQGLTGLTTEARIPGAEKVFRVSQGKRVDTTLEFCPQILSPKNDEYNQNQRALAGGNINKLASGSEPDDETSSALLSLAYQYTFCRQFDEALRYLNLWPEQSGRAQTTRKTVKAAFAESVRQDYPEFAALLMPSGGAASAQISDAPPKISMFLNLGDQETFLAAKLTSAEQGQIIGQVKKTSFDVPDDWESELRVRHVPLGGAEGLVVRGTRLLCGATGNCQTWVFRRDQGNWVNLFEQEAPIAEGFGFDQATTNGVKNLLVSANVSATKGSRALYKFDAKFYRQTDCYDVTAEQVMKIACK